MSLLSAGKQISVGGDRSYGRGLFVADPQQVQRKARKQLEYQQELRAQMEEARKRKEDQKRKEMEEDIRLEQKFNEEVRRQSEKKNDKPNHNDKNMPSPPPPQQRSQLIKPDAPRDEPRQQRREEFPPLKFEFTRQNQQAQNQDIPYMPRNGYQMPNDDDRYYEETSHQKLKVLRQALEEKVNEVYRRIKGSQNLEIDKQLELVRKKIQSSNTTYEHQNPKVPQLEDGFSHFYKIPKKQTYGQTQFRNLDYDVAPNPPRNNNYAPQQQNIRQPTPQQSQQQRFSSSRRNQSRETESRQQLWGVKNGKNNFLGNREALDYKIDDIMNRITAHIEEHD